MVLVRRQQGDGDGLISGKGRSGDGRLLQYLFTLFNNRGFSSLPSSYHEITKNAIKILL